jgi:hypothetical protein
MGLLLIGCAASRPQPRSPAEAEGALDYFAGQWTCQGHMFDATRTPFAMQIDAQRQLGAHFLVIWYTPIEQGSPVQAPAGLGVWGFNPGRQQFSRSFYDAQGNAEVHVTSQGWQGNRWSWAGRTMLNSKMVPFRHDFDRTDDNHFAARFFVLDTGEMPFDEEMCERRTVPSQ